VQTLKTRRLFILRNARNAKYTRIGYVAGAWRQHAVKFQDGTKSFAIRESFHLQAHSKLKSGAFFSLQNAASRTSVEHLAGGFHASGFAYRTNADGKGETP
jgi:hypothetical protein